MKRVFILLTLLTSVSVYASDLIPVVAADFQLEKKCEGTNQYDKKLTAKLYLSPDKNSNAAILIASGSSKTRSWESVSIGSIDNFQFKSDDIRMALLTSYLYHKDYYALRGTLDCGE